MDIEALRRAGVKVVGSGAPKDELPPEVSVTMKQEGGALVLCAVVRGVPRAKVERAAWKGGVLFAPEDRAWLQAALDARGYAAWPYAPIWGMP